jgi:transcriptional regulator with XRE-family HTH domain
MLLIDEILTRLKKYLGTEVDAEIARALNVSPQRLSNWPKRGTIPWVELCTFAVERNLSFDWLLTGHEKGYTSDFSADWSDDLKNLCLELKEILETADDVSIAALKMNMAMIKGAVKDRVTAKKDREERIRLKKRVDHLEKELKTREPHGCAEAPGDYLPTAEKET